MLHKDATALKTNLGFRGQIPNNSGILTYRHQTHLILEIRRDDMLIIWLFFSLLIKRKCLFPFLNKISYFPPWNERDINLAQNHSKVKYIILMLLFWLICSTFCSILLFCAFNRIAGKSTHLHISTLPAFLHWQRVLYSSHF